MRLKREAKAKADSDKENEEAAGNPDILGEQEDQDVIF
jgi:V-type H+-transporting ATPase subunit D